MKKLLVIAMCAALCAGIFTGCGKKEATVSDGSSAVAEVSAEPEAEPEDLHPGEARSMLTGEWINEELVQKRPLAVMIGNTKKALPQYGVKDAQVMIEAPVEGGETRMMGIFGDYASMEKIESIRSCRLYYIDWALEFDAFYAHCGQAYLAKDMLNSGVIDDLNALEGKVEHAMYKRDSSRKAPHNLYTDGELTTQGIQLKGYRTEYEPSFEGHYKFNTDDGKQITLDQGEDAYVVQPGYLVNKPWFVYNPDDGLYYRYEYGDKQIDGIDNSQLSCKNIILQACEWSIADKEVGYLSVNTMSGGSGYYVTNGKCIPVTWSKDSQSAPTRYFTEDGTEITVNQGKTWVCIIQDTYADKITFYHTMEEFQQ